MYNLKALLKSLMTLLIMWFFGHVLYIVIDGLTDTLKKADVAVILGNKVNDDGTLSERLEKRLECGLMLYRENRIKKIIVSGGLGREGYYEGDKMKEYLVSNKVPDSVIIVDNFGNNTRATVDNTLKLKDSLHFVSVIVVSQYFHVTRTKMLFKKRGFPNATSISPKYFEFRDLYSILREFTGYYTQ
ncbi:YdcF family protein [Flavobacterium sp.]|uniref:YdcF family protein n=1 Tax=Flavobacterium sp. TaxID=239 RepID=UPI00374CABF1